MKPLLIVDGYNVIGAWADAKRGGWPLAECRDRLVRALADYGGYTGYEIIVVFDGWQTDRRLRSYEREGEVSIVFTRSGETADHFIERTVAQTPVYREVRVATSDALEQLIVLSRGAVRVSARELLRDMRDTRSAHTPILSSPAPRETLAGRLTETQRQALENLRRGKQ